MPAPITYPPIRCGGCRAELAACDGLHGEWMHASTRAEVCPAGGFARPQTPDQIRLREAS